MRSKLLASVAVASITMLAIHSSANAAATMKISGSYESNMSWTQASKDESVVNTPSSGAFIGRFRLQLDPSFTADSLTIGARLRTNAADGTFGYDRAYGYATGNFGTVNFGYKGALGYAGTFGEVYGNDGQGMVGPDQASVALKAFKGKYDSRIDGAMGNYIDATGGITGNYVQYETPIIAGFGAGIGYAPQLGGNAKDWSNSRGAFNTPAEAGTPTSAPVDAEAGAYTNAVELALKYSLSLDGFDMNAAAGYITAKAPKGIGGLADTTTNLNLGPLVQNLRGYGASISFLVLEAAYFEVGYSNGGKTGNKTTVAEGLKPVNSQAMTVTAGYHVTKDIAVGGYYGQGYAASADLAASNHMREYGIGGQYTVIPGLSVYLAGDHVDATMGSATGSTTAKANVLSVGSTIVF